MKQLTQFIMICVSLSVSLPFELSTKARDVPFMRMRICSVDINPCRDTLPDDIGDRACRHGMGAACRIFGWP